MAYISPAANSTTFADRDISPILAMLRAVAANRQFAQIIVTGATVPQKAEVTDFYARHGTVSRFRGEVYGAVKWVKATSAVLTRNRQEDGAQEKYFLARRVNNRLAGREQGPEIEVLVLGSPSISLGEIVPVVYDEDGAAICLLT